MLHLVFSPPPPPPSVLHRDAEEEAVVMETTGPEAVPVHSKENPPGHRGVPTTEEVKAQTRRAAAVVFCPNSRTSFN